MVSFVEWCTAGKGSGDMRGCGHEYSYWGCSVAVRQEDHADGDHADGRLKVSGPQGSSWEQMVAASWLLCLPSVGVMTE